MDINGNWCVICPTGAAITQFRKVEVKRREDRIITLLWSLMWWRFKERKRRSSCSYDSRGPCLIVSPLTSSATKSSHTKIVSPEQSRLWPACCWPQWHHCWCASTGGLHAVSEVSLTLLTSWHESQQDLESVNSRFLQYQKPACTLWTCRSTKSVMIVFMMMGIFTQVSEFILVNSHEIYKLHMDVCNPDCIYNVLLFTV